MNKREKIFSSVYDIIINNIFLNEVLLKYAYEDNLDKAYLKRSISGILENKLLIDYVINKYSNTKINKLDKKVYVLLLCSIYELLFMDNQKQYAVLNEYVEIIKKQKTQFHANFTNAILRNILKNENRNKLFNDNNIAFNIKYSIPENLYIYLKQNLNIKTENIDNELEKIFKYYYTNDYISFRLNRIDDNTIERIINDLETNNIDYYLYDKSLKLNKLKCIMAKNINDLYSIDSFKNGLLTVQDISSIYYIDKLYKLLNNKISNDLKVLDSCASPGGKSLAFLQAFDNHDIDIYICDKTDDKLNKIKSNIIREKIVLNNDKLHILKNDALSLNNVFVEKFDIVILDVPCSGLGIIKKKQDIKFNFDENKTNDLINLQNDMLNINKNYVKLNGYFCYSTCTINKLENDDMIDKFLIKNDNFKLIYKEQILSNEENQSDGFYFAIMKRTR